MPGIQRQFTSEEVNLLHLNSDKDAGAGALHHTLGQNPSQASPGNHTHNGKNSRRLVPDFLQFDTSYTGGSIAPGMLAWNDTDGTLEFRLKGNNVTLQIGQEQNVRARNTDSVAFTDGMVVYSDGATGTFHSVKRASASAEAASSVTLGMVTEPIAKNTEGFITTFGMVRNLNTSALTEGAIVWLGTTPGTVTTTKPVAPVHAVQVGLCVRSHPNLGVIFVKVQNGYELDELHNVKITSPTDGQYLRYQASTGLWVNSA